MTWLVSPSIRASARTRLFRTTLIWWHKLGKACVDCGESNLLVLEYDHARGEKCFNIMEGARRAPYVSLAKLAEEIAKCDLVCSNCHTVRTWEREEARGHNTLFTLLQVRGVL